MKLFIKTLWQLIMKKKAIENWKQQLKWWKLKRSGTEKINLIEESKKIGIDEVAKQYKIVNASLKYQI